MTWKMYKVVARPAKLYGLEKVALIKRQEVQRGGRIEDAVVLIRSFKEGHHQK